VSLSAADVAEIMRLVEQSTFDELTLEMDGTKLTLRRGGAVTEALSRRAAQNSEASAGAAAGQSAAGHGAAAQSSSSQGAAEYGSSGRGAAGQIPARVNEAPSAALANASPGTASNSAATHVNANPGTSSARSPLDANTHEIQSPLLGTFYRSPKPGAPPFVDVGSVVEEDTTVAIIEVMKLMNTVRAGVRGVVTEVLAADGALVEFEQPLLRVRKAG